MNLYAGITALITLDVDNDRVACGNDKTHDLYSAFIFSSDQMVYRITFIRKDRSESLDTRNMFIEMLEGVRKYWFTYTIRT